jgi:hypothetical protein
MPAANALRRAFVVMPFGKKEVPKDLLKQPKVEATAAALASSEALKIDFDALFDDLLAPALRQAGCEPFRATDEKAAGDIRKDMFFELVTADLVLADISILNANALAPSWNCTGSARRAGFWRIFWKWTAIILRRGVSWR